MNKITIIIFAGSIFISFYFIKDDMNRISKITIGKPLYNPISNREKIYSISGIPVIIDGDTIKLKKNRVRFKKIDVCEIGDVQPLNGAMVDCGLLAKKHLAKLIQNQFVTCIGNRRDAYGRFVASCELPNGQDIGALLVRNGYGFPRLSEQNISMLKEAALQAKAEKRGLWSYGFQLHQ